MSHVDINTTSPITVGTRVGLASEVAARELEVDRPWNSPEQ